MTKMQEKDRQIIERFQQASHWEEKYQHLINVGKELPGLRDAEKTEDIKVRGCQSQVWLQAHLDDQGLIHFAADSDALIVRGLVALLVQVYSGHRPAEILSYQPEFIDKLELANHLSPSRANGLYAMLKQIKFYALAYQAKLE